MYQDGKNISFTDRSNNSVDILLHDIRKSKPLTTAEEYELWHQMRQGSDRARNELIFANLRYVVTTAKKYLTSGAAFEDLLMAGSLGITRAADLFDASLEFFRFISFATWHIECEVRKAAYDHIKYKGFTSSIDEPVYKDDGDSDTMTSTLRSPSEVSPEWYVRYGDTLKALKSSLNQQY